MKKGIIILIVLTIIVISPLVLIFMQYRAERIEVRKFNREYEEYREKTVYGTNIGSLINFAVDNNEKYEIAKDDKGNYIDDDKYYMTVEIKLLSLDNEYKTITYAMETIVSLGTDRFVKNFNVSEFKCTDISYNSYGRIRKLTFELSE